MFLRAGFIPGNKDLGIRATVYVRGVHMRQPWVASLRRMQCGDLAWLVVGGKESFLVWGARVQFLDYVYVPGVFGHPRSRLE